ncbi:MAG TPA: hypothetical protein ENO22_11025 [candidate division Zixibacteria bacterium]|nr:hypothetical protein [candidate division Zixibacteria bacterium]
MLKHIIISTACLLLLVSSASQAGTVADQDKKPNTQDSRPRGIPASTYTGKMQLSDDFFDFGYMPLGSRVNHIFWLKNVGSDTLEIIKINPG